MNQSVIKRQVVSTLTKIILILIITLTIAPIIASAAAPDVTASKIYSDYIENDNMTVDSAINVTDGDTNVTGAKVSIGDGYVSSEDFLYYTTINGISGSYNDTKGILTLTGNRSGSDYQAAFRNVKYRNSNENPNTNQRNITFAIGNSSLYSPDTGHYYELISDKATWHTARTAASAKSFYGLQGYLATITSAEENDFLETKVSGDAWIGANDSATEGKWRWVTGPEGTEDEGQGRLFWQGAANGFAVDEYYNSWNSGEPNDYLDGDPGEDFAYMYGSRNGTWNDFPTADTLSYFVEYGGMTGDPTLNLTATIIVNITAVNDAPTVPGAFTSPTDGQEKNGTESMTVRWGASTDPEGDAVKYDLWYFNGTLTQIGNLLGSNSMVYTLPEDDTTSAMFRVYANDTELNSSARDVTFTVLTSPVATFVSPTPANNTNTTNTSIEINASITELNLESLIYNWNGTNYTMYDDSLVLMMNFDDVTSLGESVTDVVDHSNYSNDGSVSGSTYTTAGKYGGSFVFNANNNDNITIPDSASLDITTEITLSAWIKASSWGTNHWDGGIIGKDASVGDTGYVLRAGGSENLSFTMANSTNWPETTSSGVLTLDTWHHVAATYDGSMQIIYVDGVEVGNNSISCLIDTNDEPVRIGNSHHNTRAFNGSIDEVRIWDRGLSADEIYQQYVSNLNKVDSDSWELYVNQSKNSTEGLIDGIYTYQIFATDLVGNSNHTETRTVTVDTTPPTLTIDLPQEGYNYNTSTVVLNVTANEIIDTWQYSINGTANVTFIQNATFSSLPDGNHNITVYANDSAGNMGSTIVNFTIDAAPTNITFGQPTASFTIVSGHNATTPYGSLVPDIQTDDNYTRVIISDTIEDGLTINGTNYNSVYIGSNGYLTFGHGNSGFSPLGIPGYTLGPMIAAMFTDIDVSKGGDIYMYGDDLNDTFSVTWKDVAPYSTPSEGGGSGFNTFQILLHGLGNGDFGIEFRYEDISWCRSGGSKNATGGWTFGDQVTYGEVNDSGAVEFLTVEDESNIGHSGVFAWEVYDGGVQEVNLNISENSPGGTVIGPLTADDNTPLQLIFSLLDDDGGNFEIFNDSGVYKVRVKSGATLDYETSPNHDRQINVQAKDPENNTGSAWLNISLVDVNEAPTVPGAFISPTDGQEKNGAESMTVRWGASTDPEGDAVKYDLWYFNGIWTQIGNLLDSNSTAYTLPDDDTTSAMFRVYANDTTINSSARDVTFTVLTSPVAPPVDTTAPTVALTYSANPAKVGTMTITAIYSETIVGIPKISIDQQGSTDITAQYMSGGTTVWTYVYTVVKDNGSAYVDGVATVSLSTVADAAGNNAASPIGTTFTIDTTAPTVALTYSANPANIGAMTVTATYSEAIVGTPKISIDQQGSTDITAQDMNGSATVWTYAYTVVADDGSAYVDGIATVNLSTVTDAAGNNAAGPTGTTFTIDTTAPTVTLTYSANPAKVGAMTVTATYSEAIVGTPKISIDQQGSTDITAQDMSGGATVWTYSYTVVANDGSAYIDGVATVSLSTVTDVMGNNIAGPTGTTFTIDTTAPIITTVTPTASSKVYKSGGQEMYVNFTYVEANPGNYTIQIRNATDIINSMTATATGTPVNVSFTMSTTAADGSYNVIVTMFDTASNTNTVTEINAVFMDSTPPTALTNLIHTDDAPGGYDNDNSIDISWTASTDDSSVTYRIYRDGVLNSITTNTAYIFTNETEGSHTYNVNAVDSGNISAMNESVTVIVDHTNPVIHNLSLGDISPSYGQLIVVTVNVTDLNMASVTAGSTALTHRSGALWNGTIAAGYGANTVTVTAYDKASNSAENTSLTYTGLATSSGSSNGGVSYPASLPENVVNNEVKGTTFSEPVSSADLNFEKGYVTSVTVDAKDTMSEVMITIQKLVGKPSEIKIVPPSGSVHSYHDIELGQIENSDLAGATIQFRAEKKWIADNGGDRNAVIVMRYHDGWEALETKPIGEDDEFVFFSARTPGFSTFVITMKLVEDEVAPVKVQTPETVTEVVDKIVPEQVEPEEGKSYWWLMLLMCALIGVGVVFFVYKNKKDESEK